ncbi:hypothetical protein ACKKBF_B16270 [Auxenochlorella protothecoides x Auxenochlorella symbiontica]
MNPSPARPMPGGARSVLAWGPPHRAGECRTPDRLLKGPWRGRPSVHGRSSTQASHHPGDAAGNDAGSGILSVDELDRIARHRGLSIRLTSLGPAYRIACRDEGGAILGVTQGFKVPLFPILHADTMQVQRPRRMGAGGKPAGGPAPRFKRQGLHGLGLLLFVATLAHAAACGCQRIEMLAINDAEDTHARLVRYYRRLGFVARRDVRGERLSDVPHLLVWGGRGLRMDGDVAALTRRWAPVVRAGAQSEA